MASPVWLAVYAFVCLELLITILFVIPMPKFINQLLMKIVRLTDHIHGFKFGVQFMALALVLACYDSIRTINYMETKLYGEDGSDQQVGGILMGNYDRERKFRAQRNLYLAGFALTLLLVNMRLVQLIRRQLELTDELAKTKGTEHISGIGEDQTEANKKSE